MDLRQMEYLVALADEQQFTRAAAVCRVSQSGLSAAIRSLEDELGTTLFSRTTRRVEPTDAGLALLPYARTMLAQAAAGRDAVVRATRELSGQLRVGAEQCLGIVDVPSLLERFRRRYPLVDIHFTQAGSHDLVDRVRDGDLDVAFVATTEHLTARDAHRARSVAGRAAVPAGASARRSGRVDWADLRDQDFIDFQESWAVRSLNDAACAAQGVGRRVRCTVNDVHTLLAPRPARPRRRARAGARRLQAAGGRARRRAAAAELDAAVGGVGRHREPGRGIRPAAPRDPRHRAAADATRC